jgi:hypothetical protein
MPAQREERYGPPDAPVGERGFYRDLLVAARFFVQRATEAEESALRASDRGRIVTAPGVRHRSYVTGAILSAAAFLEASINELYLELHGPRAPERSRLPRGMSSVLGRVWSHADHEPVLQRYQIVLTVADAERFDERRDPFIDADSLIKLRDALLYTRPDRADRRRRLRVLEQRLKTKFDGNQLAAADAYWFPDQCLSSSCAAWAVQAAEIFSQEFCRRMALPSRGLQRIESTARAAVHSASTTAPNVDSMRPATANGASPSHTR